MTYCKVVGAQYDSDQPSWQITVARAQDNELLSNTWPQPTDIPPDIRQALREWLEAAERLKQPQEPSPEAEQYPCWDGSPCRNLPDAVMDGFGAPGGG